MLTRDELKKIDQSGMCSIYDKWPNLADKAFSNSIEKIQFEDSNHIVFAGMGGSGTIGDVFSAILSKTDIHVEVVKGYHLPKTVKSDSLLVCTSVSGNTVETNSILKEGISRGCKIISFSSNGKMEEKCLSEKIEYRKIPMQHSPRTSFVEYLYTMINVLSPIIPISDSQIKESIIELKKIKQNISSENISNNNSSYELAKWITKIPIIYYPWGLHSVAIRFKNSLQENTKMPAMVEDVIEASHNSIVSWEGNHQVQPILIQGKDDYVKTKERWIALKEYFNENEIDYNEIYSSTGNILAKIVGLIYKLDYTSIYKALLSNIDPTPVNSISILKKKIQEKNNTR